MTRIVAENGCPAADNKIPSFGTPKEGTVSQGANAG